MSTHREHDAAAVLAAVESVLAIEHPASSTVDDLVEALDRWLHNGWSDHVVGDGIVNATVTRDQDQITLSATLWLLGSAAKSFSRPITAYLSPTEGGTLHIEREHAADEPWPHTVKIPPRRELP